MEQFADTLAVVTPPDNLPKDDTNVDDFNFGTGGLIRFLREGVGDDEFLELAFHECR